VDVTITDARPGAASITKSVMLVTSDGMGGSVRSQSNIPGTGASPFNVDSVPVIMADGRIHTRVTVQYDATIPATLTERTVSISSSIRDSVSLVLQSGKPMIVAQSTDPVSDRKVSVEVKATILR
jgi:hypothetical protein